MALFFLCADKEFFFCALLAVCFRHCNHMALNKDLNLQSFNDVASFIASENEKLSHGIADNLRKELLNIRTEFQGDIDNLAANLKTNVAKVDANHAAHSERIERIEDTLARMQRLLELVISGIPNHAEKSSGRSRRR